MDSCWCDSRNWSCRFTDENMSGKKTKLTSNSVGPFKARVVLHEPFACVHCVVLH